MSHTAPGYSEEFSVPARAALASVRKIPGGTPPRGVSGLSTLPQGNHRFTNVHSSLYLQCDLGLEEPGSSTNTPAPGLTYMASIPDLIPASAYTPLGMGSSLPP